MSTKNQKSGRLKRVSVISRVFLFISICMYVFTYCQGNSQTQEKEFTVVTAEREDFSTLEDTYGEEVLFRPFIVRENPVTKELVVLDNGNNCLYFFTADGEYIRRAGRKGKGPGDLLDPLYLAIDHEGEIYVFESGNLRISIFSKNGEFKTSFRIKEIGHDPNFSITKDKELVTHCNDGYYITVLSLDGSVIKQIGEYERDLSNPARLSIQETFAEVFPFEDERSGNYVVFLKYLPLVKVFDNTGSLIKEISLEKTFDITDEYPGPDQPLYPEYLSVNYLSFYHEIINRNNHYYILGQALYTEKWGEKLNVFVLDENFDPVNNVTLPLKNRYIQKENLEIKFEVLHDTQDIILPLPLHSEIYKFITKPIMDTF